MLELKRELGPIKDLVDEIPRTLETKELNRAGNSLRIFSLEHKNYPSTCVRKRARRAEKHDG